MRCVGEPREIEVQFGGKYCVTLINSNADAHVFHLHGHTFASIETAARAAEPVVDEHAVFEDAFQHGANQRQAPRRDSVVVPGGNCSRRTVCFVADNPAGGFAPAGPPFCLFLPRC